MEIMGLGAKLVPSPMKFNAIFIFYNIGIEKIKVFMENMMHQVVEIHNGTTRIKMVGSYSKCLARMKQLKDSHRGDRSYSYAVKETDSNVKFNTRTPGIWRNYGRPGPKQAPK